MQYVGLLHRNTEEPSKKCRVDDCWNNQGASIDQREQLLLPTDFPGEAESFATTYASHRISE